jgi:predicted dehydrogenase
MIQKDKIPCAIIGTGRIGSSLERDRYREKPATHAGAVYHNPRTFLAAGSDPDGIKRDAFGRQWKLPGERLFSDPETMLKSVQPGIVHIASDTETHISLLSLCLDLAVPVIVLEKPIGSTLEEARAILPRVERAETEGTSRILVNHERRFARDYRRARDLIHNREFGELLSIHGRLYMGKTKSPASVLWHDGTHMVDIISFLAGNWEIQSVQGKADDTTGNCLIFGRGIDTPGLAVTMEASPGRDHLTFELDLSFERGRIRIGNGLYEEWESKASRLYEHFRSLSLRRESQGRFTKKSGYFSHMMEHAVELHDNPGTRGVSTFQDGLGALFILDAAISMGGKNSGQG